MQGLAERISERARALGFHAIGFAAAAPLTADHERYLAFVAAGMHGDMGYLAEHAAARRDVACDAILPGAATVICLARRYDRAAADEASDAPLARTIARYARGRDYHGFLRKRLAKLAAYVRSLAPGTAARAVCDTAPVLERAWAARAGLGFVGKNGLLIIPGQGSFCLLGEVITTLALEPTALGQPIGERCGSCRACLDACPTEAFTAPFVLDPRRCIAYATIEARSAAAPEVAAHVGEHLFGCDDCQSACPYNRVAAPPAADTAPFRPLPVWGRTTLADLAGADEAGFAALAAGSPVRRAGRSGMARNAALVARARAGDADAAAALAAAARHDHPMVRATAELDIPAASARNPALRAQPAHRKSSHGQERNHR
jgi:epoxyqueuosine reductase